MYHRVLFLLCILSLIQIIRSQEGYEPEFIIIQPPSPSPPTDYDPHATIKSEPYVEAKVEGASKSKEDSKLSTPPAKIEETPKSASHETEPKAKVSKPESTVAPTKAEPTPPPQSHPKAIPQKVEAKKEPKIAEISSSPQAADEPKAPPQNFKHDDCLSDTIFVIDSTSSVRNLFEQHRVYASNVVKEMDISPETNHIGVVLYSSKQRQSIKISLSDPQRKDNITAKINSLPYLSGITATGAALHLTIKDLEHRRQNAMTNVVVISDGFSYDLVEEPVKQLQQLSNVRIFAVSLGESYRKFEMLMIASHEENFLTGADSYKELVRRLHQCNEGLRKGDKSETKVDETATGVTESPSSQGQTTASTATTTKTPKKEVINKVKSTEKNVVKSSESSESSEEKEAVLATTKTPKPTTEKPKPTTEKPSSTKSTQKPSPKPVEIKNCQKQ
uniref:VWFA domain-containing protein n=1 Tax=Panagrolaimus superbus TaxID=310955 RepID=A0A914Y472_9BILA